MGRRIGQEQRSWTKLASQEREVFVKLSLGNGHGSLDFVELLYRTIDGADARPREVVKRP